MSNETLPIYTASVVGGGVGGRLSLTGLTRSPRYQVVAAADVREDARKRLESEYPGIVTYATHEEMFEKSPTEVVCVSTYAPSHEPITMDALKLNLKGILVEKPLGHTLESGRRLLEAIRKRNLPMAVPHGLLAKKTPAEIMDLVQGGAIGKLNLVEVQNRGWDIINAGIHWSNFFVKLTANEPLDYIMAQCDTSGKTVRDGIQVETTGVTSVVTKSGVRFVMHTGDAIPVNCPGKDLVFRIHGDLGHIEFWGWENGYRIVSPNHPGGETIRPEEFP